MLSHGVVDDAENVNAQERVRTGCTFPRSRTFVSMGTLNPDCLGFIPTNVPRWVHPCRAQFPLPSAGLGCEDPDPLALLPSVRPVSGAGFNSWLLVCGVVSVPRVSRGLPQHIKRPARGALTHMGNVQHGAELYTRGSERHVSVFRRAL